MAISKYHTQYTPRDTNRLYGSLSGLSEIKVSLKSGDKNALSGRVNFGCEAAEYVTEINKLKWKSA